MFLDKVHHPERVLNIHFYMPPKQAAVDVMSCGQTDRDVIDFVHGDVAAVRAVPVRSTQGEHWFHLQPGMGGGEAGVSRGRRRRRLHAPGSRPDVPDQHRLRRRPFRMMDQVGLDVVLDIEEHYCAEHPEYPEGPRRLLRSYMEQGRLGVKSGAGLLRRLPTSDRAAGHPVTAVTIRPRRTDDQ